MPHTTIPITNTVRTPKVWVVKDTGRDIDDAARFGQVMPPIFRGNTSPYDVGQQVTVLRREVLPFASVDDFVLAVGPMSMVCTMCAVWTKEFGEVRMLVWNRHGGGEGYVERRVRP